MSWRVVGANFDQMHMNTNLEWVVDHPDTMLVGVCDEFTASSTGSMQEAVDEFDIPTDRASDSLNRTVLYAGRTDASDVGAASVRRRLSGT